MIERVTPNELDQSRSEKLIVTKNGSRDHEEEVVQQLIEAFIVEQVTRLDLTDRLSHKSFVRRKRRANGRIINSFLTA